MNLRSAPLVLKIVAQAVGVQSLSLNPLHASRVHHRNGGEPEFEAWVRLDHLADFGPEGR